MSGSLADVCDQARTEFALLGPAGVPLLAVVDVVARIAGHRDPVALDEPTFALDVLDALAGTTLPDGAALAGRVLGHLRSRSGPRDGAATHEVVTVAAAVAKYEAGAFRALSANSQRSYRTWTRRLVVRYGDRPVAEIDTGDLRDLITEHTAGRAPSRPGAPVGKQAAINAVTAYRHLWTYLEDKTLAKASVAKKLSKPPRPVSARRGFRRDEAWLMRRIARLGRDPMLDELVVLLAERALLRREEINNLRIRDVDLGQAIVRVQGKGEKPRTMPLTPGLATFVRNYLEDRRPAHLAMEEWLASDEPLLRERPSPQHPNGRPVSPRRIGKMLERFHRAAPSLFADGDLCLHSFRHTAANYLDQHYGRGMTRRALGHEYRRSPTDWYVDPPRVDELREALTAYETYLLAHDDGVAA